MLFRSFQVCLGYKGNELPTTQSLTGISLENNNSSIFMLYEVLAFYEYRYMTFVLTLRRNQAFCCKISLCHVLELVMINTYKPLLLVVEKLWIYWLSNYLTKANNIRPDNDSSLHVSLIRHISLAYLVAHESKPFIFCIILHSQIVTVVDRMTYLCFMMWISKIFLILLEKIGICLNSKKAWEWGYD